MYMENRGILSLFLLIILMSGLAASSEIPYNMYYNFEGAEDSTIQDKSETGGVNAELSSGARFTTNSYYGDYAVSVDQGSYIEVEDQSDILYQDSGFTFMAWYNPSNTGNTGIVMLGACCEPRHGYTIQQHSGELRFWGSEESANDNNNLYGGSAVSTWTHAAVTVTDSGTLYMYQDGNQVGSTNFPVPTSPNNAGDTLRSTPKLALGGEDVDGDDEAGVLLDEVRVYDNYMTQSEIQEAMNQPIELESGITICDSRGIFNECISNSTHEVSGKSFNISSVFQAEASSVFRSAGAKAVLDVSNASYISGLWEGSFDIRTGSEFSTLKSGARLRPEGGKILVN